MDKTLMSPIWTVRTQLVQLPVSTVRCSVNMARPNQGTALGPERRKSTWPQTKEPGLFITQQMLLL